jgi:hypothetical protein
MSFIDVDNGRLNSVPGEWNRVKNCFQIFRSLPEDCLTRDEKACFLKVYFNRELSEGEIDDYLARVGMWKSWKRQRKRLLKALRLKKAKIKR